MQTIGEMRNAAQLNHELRRIADALERLATVAEKAEAVTEAEDRKETW